MVNPEPLVEPQPHPVDSSAPGDAGSRLESPRESNREPDRAANARRRHASRAAAFRGVALTPWHRRLVVTAALGLAASGLLWMVADQGLVLFPELDGSSARSRMHLLLMVHGVLAYGGAVLFGSLLGRHIPAGLRSGRRTVTGIASLSLVGALLLTALLLYYAGSETLRSISSVSHQVLGVAAIVVLCVHIIRRARPRPSFPPGG